MVQSLSKEWPDVVGTNIRKTRPDQRLTLDDLSRLSGVEAASLSKIERGKRDPKLSTLVEIATALRIALPKLFQADGEVSDSAAEPNQNGYDLDGE